MRLALLSIIMASLITPAFAGERPVIVAHRGASHDAPENTMAAFELAWEQGADAIEGDFHLTADGQIVCMHDHNAKRTAGVDRALATMTLAEVQQLDVGRWKHERFAGQHPPTLEQVLASLPPGKRFYIEIKCGPEIMPELVRVLSSARERWDDLRIISFNRDVVTAAKKALPQIRTFWLTDFKTDDAGVYRPSLDEVLDTLRKTGADEIGARGVPEHVTESFIGRLKAEGYNVHVWTIDDPAVARTFAGRGADSITTNRPAFIREALDAGSAQPK